MASDNVEKTSGGNLKKPSLATVTGWVKDAWKAIPDSMISRAFLKTGISNHLDGTQDDILWEEDLLQTSDQESEDDDDQAGWDTDVLTEAEYLLLFGESDDDDEPDFEGF
jgi:hypothetical protein